MLKPLVILDLDNTLIFSYKKEKKFSFKLNDFYITNEELPHDFKCINKYHTLKRPHLHEFLEFTQKHFDIAVWTAAGVDYAKEICENIGINDKILFLNHSEHCNIVVKTMSSSIYVKDLNTLSDKYYLNKVLIIDDLAESARNNTNNLIHINPFYGDLADTELLKLIKYLDSIKHHTKFTDINHKKWRNA